MYAAWSISGCEEIPAEWLMDETCTKCDGWGQRASECAAASPKQMTTLKCSPNPASPKVVPPLNPESSSNSQNDPLFKLVIETDTKEESHAWLQTCSKCGGWGHSAAECPAASPKQMTYLKSSPNPASPKVVPPLNPESSSTSQNDPLFKLVVETDTKEESHAWLQTCSNCGGWGHPAAECPAASPKLMTNLKSSPNPASPKVVPPLNPESSSNSQNHPFFELLIETDIEESHAWQPTLKILLHTMDGTDTFLEVERLCSALDVKAEIAQARGLPQQCIILIRDAMILDNNAVFGENGEDVITIMLVFSPECIYQQLEQEVLPERRTLIQAFDDLIQIVEQGDERGVNAVRCILKSASSDIRRAALDCLSKLARKGDICTVTLVRSSLEDADWKVRRAAVNALSAFAEHGDEVVIEALLTRFADQDREVRAEAVQALAEITRQGDKNVEDRISRLMRTDTHQKVREAAEKALTKISWSSQQSDEHAPSSGIIAHMVITNRLLCGGV